MPFFLLTLDLATVDLVEGMTLEPKAILYFKILRGDRQSMYLQI